MDSNTLNHKTILITGAAGFIGASLALWLKSQYPDIRIIGLDRVDDYYDPALKEYRIRKIAEHSDSQNWQFIRADLADKDVLKQLFEQEKPDMVVHLAAQAGVRYSIDQPEKYIESNVIGFFNLLEAMRRADHPVQHFVFASSSSVYGLDTPTPFSASAGANHPVSLYAATKKADEALAYSYAALYGIPTTGLRFFTVYGPAGRPDMACFKFTELFSQGKKIRVYNHGNCARDFTYIQDICEGMEQVLVKGPSPVQTNGIYHISYGIYNIGHGSPVRLIDFISTLEKELIRQEVLPTDFDFAAHTEYTDMQAGDVEVTYADTSALESDYGYKPHTSLTEGIRRFVQWYKNEYGVIHTCGY